VHLVVVGNVEQTFVLLHASCMRAPYVGEQGYPRGYPLNYFFHESVANSLDFERPIEYWRKAICVWYTVSTLNRSVFSALLSAGSTAAFD